MIDAELAARLNAVDLPTGLLARLRSIPLADDADLDAALADVPLPAALTQRLSMVPSVRERWPALARQAAAAAMLCALSLGYALSVMAFVAWRFEERALAGDALRSTAWRWTEAGLDTFDSQVVHPDSGPAAMVESLAATTRLEEGGRAGIRCTINEPLALAAWTDVAFNPSAPVAFSVDELSRCAVERASVRLNREAGFDRFWRQTGLLPWLAVARQPAIEAPLATDDASYRLVRRELAEGRLPSAAVVRVEEFLAAIDYGLATGESQRPTIVAVAPSPFRRLPEEGAARRWLVMIAGVAPQSGSLDVRFNPERVKAYRLIGCAPASGETGHEHQASAEEFGGNTDVRTDRAAVVLLEIEPAERLSEESPWGGLPVPSEANDGLGRPPHGPMVFGEVSYRGPDPDEGTATVSIDEASFRGDFDSSPIAWRQAALVALSAESLAGSPFAEQTSLGEIAGLARQIEPRVSDRAGWREFIEMLVRAQTVRGSLLRAF
ncbi:MAG TPA: von Willebrand factor type A domain-containing protein [Pirellulales bacterium]|nr:von Willebrand factor type A domain-containing protein [Pirellulales bacterium]